MSIKPKWMPLLFLLPLLAACGGSYVPADRCPYGGVLATTENLPTADGTAALIYGAKVMCETAGEGIEAEITVYGDMLANAKNMDVTIFAALVDKDDNVVTRTQEDFKIKKGLFEVDMPVLVFDPTDTGSTGQAEFYVGFVLSEDELKANRAAWRENLNID
ncbi:MAG: hypothetical protein ACPG30_07120 [Parvibaculales bacterium]